MKTFIKNNILNFIILILLAVLIIQKIIPVQEKPVDWWCVEWEAGLTRETLVYECYNFKTQNIMCDWAILPDNTLITSEYGNFSNIYSSRKCTRYVDSKQMIEI